MIFLNNIIQSIYFNSHSIFFKLWQNIFISLQQNLNYKKITNHIFSMTNTMITQITQEPELVTNSMSSSSSIVQSNSSSDDKNEFGETLLRIFKLILGSLCSMTAVYCAGILIVLFLRDRKRKKESLSAVKFTHLIVLFLSLVRTVLFFLPLNIYSKLFRLGAPGLAIQNILDLSPEFLFLLTYVLILCSWINLYYKCRKLSIVTVTKHQLPVTTVTFISFAVFLLLIMLSLSGITMIFKFNNKTLEQIHGILIAVLSLCTTIAFFVVFAQILRTVLRMPVKHPLIRKALQRLSVLAVGIFITLVIRSLYIIFLNSYLTSVLSYSDPVYAVVWALYFIVTEYIGCAVTLALMTWIHTVGKRHQHRNRNRSYYSDNNDDNDDDDGGRDSGARSYLSVEDSKSMLTVNLGTYPKQEPLLAKSSINHHH
eukprot:gb/GECH01002648.1/.p1 GENE.gb/GECH01002648.1/~~gb/GECH01002648.1/.p1  ORF type:complete len:426 (+),score=75.47 gb/GECH01002648.1/:1-1278(+)